MQTHLYRTGDRVVFDGHGSNTGIRTGVYTVVRALPASQFGFEYRVKSSLDPHERVFAESMLRLEHPGRAR